MQYHIALEEGSVGRYVILTGDPRRCESISSLFDHPKLLASNREFTTWGGEIYGERAAVCSTGIGGPSAAIAIEELAAAGADTFFRVGTCGGIDLSVKSGDLIVATAAVRQEGTSLEYAPIEYPAAADYTLVRALADAGTSLGSTVHLGVVQSKDSFYGQHSPKRMPVSARLLEKWEAWKCLGVLASEMECAALFTAAASLRVRCGAVLSVIWNQERKACGFNEPDFFDMDPAVHTAVEAIRGMILADSVGLHGISNS